MVKFEAGALSGFLPPSMKMKDGTFSEQKGSNGMQMVRFGYPSL